VGRRSNFNKTCAWLVSSSWICKTIANSILRMRRESARIVESWSDSSVGLPAIHYLLGGMRPASATATRTLARRGAHPDEVRARRAERGRSINKQVSIARLPFHPHPRPCPPTSLLRRPPFLARFRSFDPVAPNACVRISPSQLTETYRWTTLLHCMCTDGPTGASGRVGTRRCRRRFRPAFSSLISSQLAQDISRCFQERRAMRVKESDDGVSTFKSELYSFVHLDPRLFCLSRDFTGAHPALCFGIA
jgi:hypothetical protein